MKLTYISNYNKSIMKLTKNKKVDGRTDPLTRNRVYICKHNEDLSCRNILPDIASYCSEYLGGEGEDKIERSCSC